MNTFNWTSGKVVNAPVESADVESADSKHTDRGAVAQAQEPGYAQISAEDLRRHLETIGIDTDWLELDVDIS